MPPAVRSTTPLLAIVLTAKPNFQDVANVDLTLLIYSRTAHLKQVTIALLGLCQNHYVIKSNRDH